MNLFAVKLVAVLALSFAIMSVQTVSAQTDIVSSTQTEPSSHPFVKKRYSITGEWSIVENGDDTQIKFSENFKTKGGPDLKVYLSKIAIDDLDSERASSNTRSIGVLKSKSGGQIYTIPEDVNLSDYKSVIIHCEAFSVLWGGFDLPANLTPLP